MKQNEVIKKIIEDNKNTEYGITHGFDKIADADDYRAAVPITTYADYVSYINRMSRGEKNCLTTYPVASMIMTSGSSGPPKKVPLTWEALNHYSDDIYKNIIQYTPEGKILHMSVFGTDLSREMEEKNILSAVYYRYLYSIGSLDTKRYVGGDKTLFSRDIHDVIFVKAWSAFFERDITAIQSIFLYDILILFHYIETEGKSMLDYMRNKSIPAEIRISEEIKEYLISEMVPDEDRLKEIEDILEEGYESIARKLWPGLSLICGIGGEFFETREELLRTYIGEVKIHYFSYVSTECMFGKARDVESKEYNMLSDNGYYEFAPLDENQPIETCDTIKIGQLYELIVTNWSGLYRYETGDIIEVVDFEDSMPIIKVRYRKNLALNLAGEKMFTVTMEEAIAYFALANDIYLYDYSIWPDMDVLPGRYLFLAEITTPQTKEDIGKLEDSFDQILSTFNPDYGDLRHHGLISRPKIVPLNTGAHFRATSQNGETDKQNKPMITCKTGRPFDYEKEKSILE